MRIRVYPNNRVKEIIAAIPKGHTHLRLALILDDQVVVLHEATVAAIVRAYTNIVLHPSRKGIRLLGKYMDLNERKHGYAKYQLIEDTEYSEDDAVKAIMNFLGMKT
ncbi:MAG: hypothetical protein DRO40_04770 [Thermoprotei archaeon]|nr:MAG: hypothetical protein DRO40_04770 [Thermoprotei archaeon]